MKHRRTKLRHAKHYGLRKSYRVNGLLRNDIDGKAPQKSTRQALQKELDAMVLEAKWIGS